MNHPGRDTSSETVSNSIHTVHSNNDSPDLEKQDTETQSIDNLPGNTASSSRRVSRIQSLTRRGTIRATFSHPLAHAKTTEAEIVDFDGPDDPYRPLNWPFRKKVITTALYGYVLFFHVVFSIATSMLYTHPEKTG